MKKTLKTAIIIVIILAVIGCAIGGYFVIRHRAMYISSSEAIAIAVKNSGVNTAAIRDADAEFERNTYSAIYEVEFESGATEYCYDIDASTGEILNSYTKDNSKD